MNDFVRRRTNPCHLPNANLHFANTYTSALEATRKESKCTRRCVYVCFCLQYPQCVVKQSKYCTNAWKFRRGLIFHLYSYRLPNTKRLVMQRKVEQLFPGHGRHQFRYIVAAQLQLLHHFRSSLQLLP